MFHAKNVLAIFAIVVGSSSAAVASPITYEWNGNNGATGSFTFDSSVFNGTSPDDILESKLTAFTFSIGGVTFTLADIVGASSIQFDATKNPPTYTNGVGQAALSGSDTLTFFTGSVELGPSGVVSTGTFVPEVPAVPEPSPFALMLAGIGALFLLGWRKKAVAPPPYL